MNEIMKEAFEYTFRQLAQSHNFMAVLMAQQTCLQCPTRVDQTVGAPQVAM